jgi:hypothetical protein
LTRRRFHPTPGVTSSARPMTKTSPPAPTEARPPRVRGLPRT